MAQRDTVGDVIEKKLNKRTANKARKGEQKRTGRKQAWLGTIFGYSALPHSSQTDTFEMSTDRMAARSRPLVPLAGFKPERGHKFRARRSRRRTLEARKIYGTLAVNAGVDITKSASASAIMAGISCFLVLITRAETSRAH